MRPRQIHWELRVLRLWSIPEPVLVLVFPLIVEHGDQQREVVDTPCIGGTTDVVVGRRDAMDTL